MQRDREPLIREIAAGDASALHAFYNSLDPFGKEMFHPMGQVAETDACEAVVRDSLSGRRYDLIIARGNDILGWAFVSELGNEYPGLGIGLSEEVRGQGFGGKLLARLVEFVRRKGNRGIQLTVVRTNDRARRLYERFGFEICGEHEGTDGLPYYRMRLEF